MTEATPDAPPVEDGRPPYPGGLDYDPNERRVSVRFLRPWSRRGRLFKVGEIVHGVPISVAKELRNENQRGGPAVEPFKAPEQQELRPMPGSAPADEES